MTTAIDRPATLSGWTPDDSTFGARLALIRQRMRWGNVKEAAQECGIPTESWRDWEQERATPRQIVEIAGRIAKRTGCDLGWLVGVRSRVTERDTPRERSRPGSYPNTRTRPEGIRRPVRLSDQLAA